MHYVIKPIALLKGIRDMSQWTYRWNIGKKVKTACYLWYIQGSDPITVVDTGAQEDHYNNEFPMTTIVSLDQGLKSVGLKLEDIKQVIVTHLHFDHIALANKYKNATFIVQKKELEFANNPHVFNAVDYNTRYFEDLKFKIIDGDYEIMPGVTALLTPGHSPGGQSIQIETLKGKAVITGFCSQMSTFIQTPFMKEKGLEVAACGLHIDCREVYDSALKVKNIADIIIPLHDPMFIGLKSIP